MNRSWGYKISDNDYKSKEDLIRYLVKAAGNNANFLLNVGPQSNGEIPVESIERMKAVGEWVREYGPSIYGTRGGPVGQRDWGVTTVKGDKVFVHILNYDDDVLFIPLTSGEVVSASAYKVRTPIEFTQDTDGVVLKLPTEREGVDYVVELSMDW
jgi:alpha-L-fucosidase